MTPVMVTPTCPECGNPAILYAQVFVGDEREECLCTRPYCEVCGYEGELFPRHWADKNFIREYRKGKVWRDSGRYPGNQ